MNVWTKCALHCALYAAIAGPSGAAGDEDDQPVQSTIPQSNTPALNAEQQHAVGLSVAHPVAAKAPERIAALGSVLDESMLIADEGEWTVAAAQEHAASAELARLTQLSKDGVGASMKMLEAAQAEDAKARSEAQVAAARFALRWGPLAAQSPNARRQLIDALAAGRTIWCGRICPDATFSAHCRRRPCSTSTASRSPGASSEGCASSPSCRVRGCSSKCAIRRRASLPARTCR